MTDVDEALGRLGAELAERDARIAELETALAGAQATAAGGPDLFKRPGEPLTGQPRSGEEHAAANEEHAAAHEAPPTDEGDRG